MTLRLVGGGGKELNALWAQVGQVPQDPGLELGVEWVLSQEGKEDLRMGRPPLPLRATALRG